MTLFRLFITLFFISIEVIAYSLESPQNKNSLDADAVVEDGLSKVDLYLLVSKSFKSTNIDSAFHYADRARISAITEEDNKGISESLFFLGKINLRRDSLSKARDDFYHALTYTNDCECDSLKSSILMFLGKSYVFQDNYSEAINNFMKSLKIADSIHSKEILVDLLDDIGLVMAFLMDYDQAMVYFERALEVQKEFDDPQNYATTLRNIGFSQQGKKQYLQALSSYAESIEIYKELNYYPGLATTNLGIGNAEFSMENYQTALSYYEAALEYAHRIDVNSKVSGPYILALCYNRIGETYLQLDNYTDAKKVLRKSIDLSEEHGMPGSKAKSSLFFSQMYEQTGNISLAFDYFKTYNSLSDSIINARNVSSITKKEMEYQYLKKQKEKELEQIRKDEAYKRKMLIYEFLIGIAILIVVSLIMIFILYRKNERNNLRQVELNQKNLELEKKNLQKELDFKNKELTTSVMYQLKKNNFIWKISEQLKQVSLLLKSDNQKSIKEIIKALDSNTSKESWEEFEYRFNDVHNNFYDELLRDFPDLTPNELKLSAFLKLNMTTKDIGTITYQSSHSITVARHRLRTKLGLERDENLVSFFSKY